MENPANPGVRLALCGSNDITKLVRARGSIADGIQLSKLLQLDKADSNAYMEPIPSLRGGWPDTADVEYFSGAGKTESRVNVAREGLAREIRSFDGVNREIGILRCE